MAQGGGYNHVRRGAKSPQQTYGLSSLEETAGGTTPSSMKHSMFIPCEANTDPVAQIQHYRQVMFMHDGDDAIMCKMFSSNLGKVALAWFHKLKSYTIKSWKQLSEKFTAWFLTSRAAPKTF